MTQRKNNPPTVYRPGLRRFLIRLLSLSSSESLWLIIAFVLGVIALAIIANFIYQAVVDPASLSGDSLLRVAVASMLLLGLAYVAFRVDMRLARLRDRDMGIDLTNLAPAHAGLILLLSPSNLEVPLHAVGHHLQGKGETRLRHVWVLTTEEARATFDELREQVKDVDKSVTLHLYHLDTPTIAATYFAVDDIFARRAQLVDLKPAQIIADLTGGFKEMSVGMALACRQPGRMLEYVQRRRDPVTGLPIADAPLHAVRVHVDLDDLQA